MSHATARASARQPSLEEFVTAGSRLLATALSSSRVVLEQAAELLPRMPDLRTLRRPDICAIPEVECPPRCVCVVTWEAAPGETLGLTIRVRNGSKVGRTFNVSATPFAGPGGSPGTPALQPTSLSLAAGRSDVVNATFTVPRIETGNYEAEILVTGAYEQCVRVLLKVRAEKTCGDERCTCEVLQGDRPMRVRAHQWYHHFQCTEPCFVGGREGDRDPDHDHG